MDDAVDFGADAETFGLAAVVEVEMGEVDAGFDGEHDAGDEGAAVLGLDVVDVDTVPVGVGSQAVAGAVEDALGVTGVLDDGADGVVDFIAVDCFAASKAEFMTLTAVSRAWATMEKTRLAVGGGSAPQ